MAKGLTLHELQKMGSKPAQAAQSGMTLQQILAQQSQPATNKPAEPSFGSRVSSDIQNAGTEVNQAITGTGKFEGQGPIQRGTGAVSAAAAAPLQVAAEILPKSVRSGIGKVGEAAGGIVNWLGDKIGSTKIAQDFVTKHPDATKTLQGILGTTSNLGNISGSILAAEGLKGGIEKGASAASDLPSAAKNLLKGAPEEIAAKQANISIDAVNPDLSGKKLVNAYKQTVTGGREITPSSIFREQGLTPDQQTINLGTRLKDVLVSKDPVKNLQALGTAMEDTESKLVTALKGDPEVNYSANKPELISNLEAAKGKIPREFSAIKDSKVIYNKVIDFAKELAAKNEDSLTGLRDGRSAFDAQAKAEFPSAFQDGKIDVSKPAGRAIKTARDIYSEHLYNSAPNGSEIQKLIGKEADIFRATDNIAPKAVAGQGKNVLQQISNKYPTLARYLKYAVYTAGADKILKATTGLGF